MNKIILVLLLLLPFAGNVYAAGGHGVHLDHAAVDVTNKASLQRGAKYYVNYCFGCHSMKYSRYSRVGEDLGLTTLQVEDNFVFTDAKVRDQMKIAMRDKDARHWFGTSAPDLSLVARAKGADWIYTYLRTFYLDDSRPFGVNNLVLKNASMPHVLWELQGWQKPVYKEGEKDGGGDALIEHLELAEEGQLSPKEFDKLTLDLVNFLVYVGEPAQLQRQQLGFWVLAFLAAFFVVAYLLKKEYWKDVH
jgi:ubiquinol-cytochrome c reductase cytochrome c1 subunit